MTAFLLRRAASAVVVVFGVVTVIFVLARLVGDPVALMAQPGMTAADLHALRVALHLDLSIPAQYRLFLLAAAHGDFGASLWQSAPALSLVLDTLPATLLLTVAALAFAFVLGTAAGAVAALNEGRWIDRAVMAVALLGQSVPNFWLALMLILVVSTRLHALPSGGIGGVSHLVLPAVALGMFSLARITRLVRSELADVLVQDYVRTARSKGLSQPIILWRHCFGNIAISLVTVVGVDFGMLIGGAVVTETIFAWPGMGRLMIQAIGHRDFPVLQAGAFVVAGLVVLSSLLADIAYALLNPKIRYA
jgi:peptide/nickel transport system permease protein